MANHLHYHRRESDDVSPKVPEGPMTAEQLDFFTEQTQRAVNKGVARYRREALVGFAVLLVGLIVALTDNSHTRAATDKVQSQAREQLVLSGRAVAVEGCNRDFLDRQQFRSLLLRLKESSERSKTQTPEQKRNARLFYDSQLQKFTLPDCRDSEHLLTDDPEARIPVIAPYYPGASYIPNEG